jgi:hypothetical protein
MMIKFADNVITQSYTAMSVEKISPYANLVPISPLMAEFEVLLEAHVARRCNTEVE